jgi:hypothetical protein
MTRKETADKLSEIFKRIKETICKTIYNDVNLDASIFVSKWAVRKYGPNLAFFMANMFYLYYLIKDQERHFNGYLTTTQIDDYTKKSMKLGRQAILTCRHKAVFEGMLEMQWFARPTCKCYRINWDNAAVKKMNPYTK